MEKKLKNVVLWNLRKFFGLDFCGALRELCPMDWARCCSCYTKWVGPPGKESPRMFCKCAPVLEKLLCGNVCWKAEKEIREYPGTKEKENENGQH